MKTRKFFVLLAIFAASTLFFQSCKQLKNIADTFTNMQNLKFKLGKVGSFRLAGIDISNKNSISDITTMDILKITQAYKTKKLPAEFILNVDAMNPNNGKNQTKRSDAVITGLDWNLYIDDVKTISGGLASPVSVPGSGETVQIPLSVSLDLYEFFGKNGYDKVVNLAMAIGGAGNNSARLKLDAQPSVRIGNIPLSYPGRITIVNTEFR